jgi:UDP-N-acetylglucosamine:LPS N-acetylglucosamine transferase
MSPKTVGNQMKCKKELKICLAASSGGHMSQLQKLSKSWDGHQYFYITTSSSIRSVLEKQARVYELGECNREHLVWVVVVLFKCVRVILCERPDVVISTGAAVGCIVCFLGKLLGAKIVWIDSITNVERISLSGRLVRPISDLFLVQWPELIEKYKNVEYAGQIV